MKIPSPVSSSFNPRALLSFVFCAIGVLLALLGSGLLTSVKGQQENAGIQFGQSYHNDVSPALRDLSARWRAPATKDEDEREERHENLNPRLPLPEHVDVPDPVIDRGITQPLPNAIPTTNLNFDGMAAATISSPGPPPDTDGAVGLTQYVQIVNQSYQVFNKTTGASVAGPTSIAAIWSGFGGVCETASHGDPIVLYDHLANRWLISQFAGAAAQTDECIAISTSSDATGSYNRYGFHLGTNFFDYPKLSVWPDGYYMATNVFNPSGTILGPQAFAFDRTSMLAGSPATFVTPGITGGSGEPSFLPADLDGTILPPSGTGNPFVSFPAGAIYKVRLFHADFATPANSTFTLIGSPAGAGFTLLCPATKTCVPQLAPQTSVDGRGDRLMFRLAYRKFPDGHEAVVGNYSVFANSVAAPRWFELRAVTTAPVVFQESTYAPDSTWRWMGSVAMDQSGDLAIGYSASDSTIHPQIRYAGRLAGDALNTLAQGETHLFDGTGSQDSTGNSRWGDYSAMTIDPVDDCTFWYTQEYYATNGSSWKTRIGSFKFPICVAPTIVLTVNKTADTNDGVCDAADCSLREALTVAGSDGLADTIIFNIAANSAGCVGTDCTITLTSPLAPAADASRLTTINGDTGTNTITLSGNNATQILSVVSGANLSLSNLNLTAGRGSNGGAITIATGGILTVTNSAIFGNTATSQGGGIFTNSGSALNLTNVTISTNSATSIAGGIYEVGTATAKNCTITNNSAPLEGGVYLSGGGSSFNIANTIIAGNSASFAPDAVGNFTSLGHNLIGNPQGANGFTATGDQTGVNPQLASLGNNGGPTQTHALQSNSPAINAGDNTYAPAYDQRYLLRNGTSDIGAYEFNGLTPSLKVTAITHLAAGDILLQGLGVANAPHTVQVSSNLTSGFSYLATVTSDATGAVQFDDAGAIGATKRFYRLTFP